MHHILRLNAAQGFPALLLMVIESHVTHKKISQIDLINFILIVAGNSPATEPVNLPPIEKKQEVPDDLICSICKDLFTDAVMIPCCGSSFCDECKTNIKQI